MAICSKTYLPKNLENKESSQSTLYNEDEYFSNSEIETATHKIGLIKSVVTQLIQFLEGEIKFDSGKTSNLLDLSMKSKGSLGLSRTNNKLDDHVYIKFKLPFDYSNEAECIMSTKGNYSINENRYMNESSIIFDSPKYNNVNLEFDRNKISSDSKNKLKSLFSTHANPNPLMVINEENANYDSNRMGSKTMKSGEVSHSNNDQAHNRPLDGFNKTDINSKTIPLESSAKSDNESGDDLNDTESDCMQSNVTESIPYSQLVSQIREFSVNTKLNRDSIQSSSSRTEGVRSPIFRKIRGNAAKSRQKLQDLEKMTKNPASFMTSTESILNEAKMISLPLPSNPDFVSASNRRLKQFDTGIHLS
jgi:hypothetical protein